ncbi:Transcriptional regulator, MerR family [Bacillus toyonensis BCT-7112]|nr:Transcriptional regulator, MerR family [Bacillus toyonensis BCT-7112]
MWAYFKFGILLTDLVTLKIEKNNVTIKNCIEVELLDEFFSTDSYSCQMQLLIENE